MIVDLPTSVGAEAIEEWDGRGCSVTAFGGAHREVQLADGNGNAIMDLAMPGITGEDLCQENQ